MIEYWKEKADDMSSMTSHDPSSADLPILTAAALWLAMGLTRQTIFVHGQIFAHRVGANLSAAARAGLTTPAHGRPQIENKEVIRTAPYRIPDEIQLLLFFFNLC